MRLSRIVILPLVFAAAAAITAESIAVVHADSVLPSQARILGYPLQQLATAYTAWAFGTPADVNPILSPRCERSQLDSRIWFLPVSVGGDYSVTCYVPEGSFIVLTPGALECSTAEGNGSTPAELKTCVDNGFLGLTYVEFTANGVATSDLSDHVVTTSFQVLPGPNLLGPDPTATMTKGYFLVVGPLSRGTHTFRAYDEFAAINFTAGITYNVVVR
jgi:hypothetical protein